MADFGLSAVMFAAAEEEVGSSNECRSVSDEKTCSPVWGDFFPAGSPPPGAHSQTQPYSGKSANLQVSSNKLLESSPVKRLKSVVGSPHYVPPEVTAGKLWTLNDVYSSFILTFRLLLLCHECRFEWL